MKNTYIQINSSKANKLIINKENYNVIACDKSCIPLKQIFENVVQENEIKVKNDKRKIFKI